MMLWLDTLSELRRVHLSPLIRLIPPAIVGIVSLWRRRRGMHFACRPLLVRRGNFSWEKFNEQIDLSIILTVVGST